MVSPRMDLRQTRLDCYLNIAEPGSRRKCFFTSLPASVRTEIYERVCPLREDHIHLNRGGIRVEDPTCDSEKTIRYACCQGAIRHSGGKPPMLDILPLILVSRQIYEDICPVIYSKSHFRISFHAPNGLKALFTLSRLAISSMVVRLQML